MSNVATMPDLSTDLEDDDAPSPYPLCQHLKACGTPCGSPALRNKRHCYFHNKMRKPSLTLSVSHHLDSPHGIQLAIQNVLIKLLDGKIDHKAAGLAFYGLQLASSNFKQMHKHEPFFDNVALDDPDELLLEAIKPAVNSKARVAPLVDESDVYVARASRPAQEHGEQSEVCVAQSPSAVSDSVVKLNSIDSIENSEQSEVCGTGVSPVQKTVLSPHDVVPASRREAVKIAGHAMPGTGHPTTLPSPEGTAEYSVLSPQDAIPFSHGSLSRAEPGDQSGVTLPTNSESASACPGEPWADDIPFISDDAIPIAGPLMDRIDRDEDLSEDEFMQIISCLLQDEPENAVRAS